MIARLQKFDGGRVGALEMRAAGGISHGGIGNRSYRHWNGAGMKRSVLWRWVAGAAMIVLAAGSAFAVTSDDAAKKAAIAAAPGKAQDDVWPKPVTEFLAGNYLERADVVLTRRSGDLASTIIRWATNSAFSHAAMVYTGAQFDQGISGTFVIEAGTSGVDLTKLSDYAENKSTFVAIRRFNREWFNAARQSRVRGVLLDKIKDTYDYWTIWRIARNLWFGVQSKSAQRKRPSKPIMTAIGSRRTNTSAQASSRSALCKRRSKRSNAANFRLKSCARSYSRKARKAACRNLATGSCLAMTRAQPPRCFRTS